MGARFPAPVQTGPGAQPASFNPLNAELNPICHLLALLEAHHILHVSRIRVNIGTVSFPGVKSGRGVTLTPNALLVPFAMKQ